MTLLGLLPLFLLTVGLVVGPVALHRLLERSSGDDHPLAFSDDLIGVYEPQRVASERREIIDGYRPRRADRRAPLEPSPLEAQAAERYADWVADLDSRWPALRRRPRTDQLSDVLS